jgi:hypothetical protein
VEYYLKVRENEQLFSMMWINLKNHCGMKEARHRLWTG